MTAITFGIIDAGVRNSENNRLSAVRLGQAAGKTAAPARLNPADPQSGRPRPAPPSAFCQVDFVWWHHFPGSLVVQSRLIAGAGLRESSEEKDGIAQATERPAPNRRTQDGIRTSPQRRRTAMGRQSQNHRKTAEYQGSPDTTIINRGHRDRQRHPKRGPNQKSHGETGTSPRPPSPTPGHQPRHHLKTAEFQGSPIPR